MAKKKMNKETIKVASRDVMMTTDYEKFKFLHGNRDLNASHVKQLQKLMLENGNLTDQFPIVISKDGFVIDGQHRLAALAELGWEVGYIVEENANIDTVRHINQGNRNWNWRDIAYSYAVLGHEDYQWFLDFVDEFPINFSPALAIATGKNDKGGNTGRRFRSGEFKVKDKAMARLLAGRIIEFYETIGFSNNDMTYALASVMKHPQYDHERMTKKLGQLADTLPERASAMDYKRRLEDIYNHSYSEDNRVRLY